MRLDEALALSLLAGTGHPTLRLFRWKPWAISLGYHQRREDIDAGRCAADGIDIVRRPTGGRAILHAEELTYSVVMTTEKSSVLEVYNAISRALLEGLRMFGVEAELQRVQPNLADEYRRSSSVSCFSSFARYEIEWGGRKLVGSAQRRYRSQGREVVLQHGSILCGPAHTGLCQYLALDDPGAREEIRERLEKRTVCIQDMLGGTVDLSSLSSAIRHGFEASWGVSFQSNDILLKPVRAYV
jgi:lipoate-protein ligase A